MENQLTQLLGEWRNGNQQALNELITNLSPELREMAARHMRKEAMGHTLQATAIVNEAYLRLYDADVDWQNRAHFLSIVSVTMRRILVDHARAKKRDKRGADALQITFDESMLVANQDQCNMLDLDAALSEFSEFEEIGAKILEMRIFSGMKMQEIAEVLCVSVATAERNLKSARAWLHKRLSA
ncbi:MAG: RNA polymerase sigma factor (TIGR02999 family) [Lentisphaeria bacterium]|jgi:RNA polymerase sigma factor (TIGR02999 family)